MSLVSNGLARAPADISVELPVRSGGKDFFAPTRRRRLGPGPKRPFSGILGPALVLIVWSGSAATGLVDPRTLAAPWTVAGTAFDLLSDGRLESNILTSALRVGQGLAFGTVVGVVLALLAGLSRLGESIIDGPVQMKRSIPTLALIPLLIFWFGIGEGMKILVITISVMIPVYIQTHSGLRAIDQRYVELAETLNLTRLDYLRHVILPGALPAFFLGMRFAITAAWLSLIVIEQINATSGIGYMIELARTYGQADVIIVGIVVYAALGLASDGLVRLAQNRSLAWRRTSSI
jgi:sulfonate transport system permease protein